MGNNITSIETVYSDARIHQRDAAALLNQHRGELPEHCFLRFAAIAVPSADGMVPIGTFEWSGLGSRASMYKLFDALAAHIAGRFEGIVAWEDGSRSGLRIVNGKAECPGVLSVLARTRFGESSIDTHRAAAEALADVLAGGDTRARQVIRQRLDTTAAREAMHAMASTDDESPLTFTTRFNNGRGGVSIDVAGYSRFVEGEEARKLAEALDPRPRSKAEAIDDARDATP